MDQSPIHLHIPFPPTYAVIPSPIVHHPKVHTGRHLLDIVVLSRCTLLPSYICIGLEESMTTESIRRMSCLGMCIITKGTKQGHAVQYKGAMSKLFESVLIDGLLGGCVHVDMCMPVQAQHSSQSSWVTRTKGMGSVHTMMCRQLVSQGELLVRSEHSHVHARSFSLPYEALDF